MNAPATISNVVKHFSPSQLALIQRTAAKDCNPDEFNQFMHTAQHMGLDPIRRQIYAFVYSKNNPAKRTMSIVTSIDGFRSIAARTGDYRPDDNATEFTYSDDEKDPQTNPLGIVKARVTIYKFSHGDWHAVTAEAYWTEYAPLKEIWEPDEKTGKDRPTGRFILDRTSMWPKMPRQMIEKCAEAKAIRRAWPDSFSNVYEQSEVDQLRTVDLTPAEYAEQGNVEKRLEAIGGADAITIDWIDGRPLDRVPIGKVGDRIVEFIQNNKDETSTISVFRERNRHALQEFWARNASDALEVKKMFEKVEAQ